MEVPLYRLEDDRQDLAIDDIERINEEQNAKRIALASENPGFGSGAAVYDRLPFLRVRSISFRLSKKDRRPDR
jgi:hypothetical protein